MGNNCNCRKYEPEKELTSFCPGGPNETRKAKSAKMIGKEVIEAQTNLPAQKNIFEAIKAKHYEENPQIKIEEISLKEFNDALQDIPKVSEIISENSNKIDIEQSESEEIYQLMPLKYTDEKRNQSEYFLGHSTNKGDIQGLGTLITKDKTVYKGTFKNGVFNGNGILISNNGDYYIGEWINGDSDGRGILVLSDGVKYEGEFKKNIKQGKGKIIYPDGTEYIGDFDNNEKSGNGMLKYKDGSFYTGDFLHNLFNGQGEYHWNDGRVYKGEFENGLMQGKGLHTWKDGSIYKGYYREGKKQGRGTYLWNDGKKYTGHWMDNEPDGKGYLEVDGKKYEAAFRNGRITTLARGDVSSDGYATPTEIKDPLFSKN